MVGIISNTAAMNAQANLEKANVESQSSIARLSSGNRIASASDDVAGLAVGTILKTNVSTLRAAFSNASQAQSLLGVADGALAGVGDILQRQKALASQATSGSLTDTARSFLNQEFQNLKSQVESISMNTNFNGIKLIDGSLFASNHLDSNTKLDATRASGDFKITTALVDGENAVINGITFNFLDDITTATPELNIDTTNNTTAANQADALMAAINNVLNYQGSNATVLSAKAALSKLEYSHTAATDTITLKARAAGTVGNSIQVNGTYATGQLTLNGTDMTTTVAANISAGGIVAVDGGLNAGTFASSGTAYNGTAKVIAQGSVSDSILRALNTTSAANTGVNLSNVSNNADFTGKIQGFKADFVANGLVNLSVKVGDFTYVARNVNSNYSANTKVTLASTEAGGGSFDVQFAANSGVSSVTNQTDADLVATRMNKAFENIVAFQKREITNYNAAGTVYPTGSTTASGDLAGSKFWLIASDFNDVQVEKVNVTAPVLGGSRAVIHNKINGETFRSGYDADGSVLSGGIGTSITNSSGTSGVISFVSDSNPKNVLVFQYASSTDLSLTNDAEANGAQKALERAFGINTGATGVNFQVGTTSSDSIGVQIQSTRADDIYKDANNVSANVDISTQENAINAGLVLDNAINAVTAIRANIGALQSRFKYASNNIQSAIQNQDAARGTFLDTDISAESTNYAQSQVRVQASISVLAQANQLSQSLLKLIG